MPHRTIPNAARGNCKRRTRKLQTPHAEIAIVACEVRYPNTLNLLPKYARICFYQFFDGTFLTHNYKVSLCNLLIINSHSI